MYLTSRNRKVTRTYQLWSCLLRMFPQESASKGKLFAFPLITSKFNFVPWPWNLTWLGGNAWSDAWKMGLKSSFSNQFNYQMSTSLDPICWEADLKNTIPTAKRGRTGKRYYHLGEQEQDMMSLQWFSLELDTADAGFLWWTLTGKGNSW